jgi:hypothetical protein
MQVKGLEGATFEASIKLNSLQTEKSSLLLKIQDLDEKRLETQLQLERVADEKLTQMLSI